MENATKNRHKIAWQILCGLPEDKTVQEDHKFFARIVSWGFEREWILNYPNLKKYPDTKKYLERYL